MNRSLCPIASSLDLLGDRWTLLVVRDLFAGKRRFDAFLASHEAIATNVLSDRLARLERDGLVTRERDPEDGRRVIYELTERGRDLTRVLRALSDWGLKHIPGTSTAELERVKAESF